MLKQIAKLVKSARKNTLRATHKSHGKYGYVREDIADGFRCLKTRSTRVERRKEKQTNRYVTEFKDHLDETVSVYQEGRRAFLAGYMSRTNPYKHHDSHLANEWLQEWEDEENEYAEHCHCCPYYDR